MTKKTYLISLLLCSITLQSMDEKQFHLRKQALLLEYSRKKQQEHGTIITHSQINLQEDSPVDTSFIIPSDVQQKELTVDEKQAPSSYSLLGIPVALYYSVKGWFTKPQPEPQDWGRSLFLPFDGSFNTHDTTSYGSNNYSLVWFFRLKPEDQAEAKIYDLNHQRLLVHKKFEKDDFLDFPFISNDGTCYALETNKDDKIITYLYNIMQSDKPKIVTYERASFIKPNDNSLHCIIQNESKFTIHDVKSGREQTIPFNDPIDTVFNLASSSPTSHILVQTTKGTVLVCNVAKGYERTVVPFKESFTLLKNGGDRPHGCFLAYVDNKLCIYDIKKGIEPRFSQPYNGSPFDFHWWSDNYCAFKDEQNTLHICDIPNNKIISCEIDPKYNLHYKPFNPTNDILSTAAGSWDYFTFHNPTNGAKLASFDTSCKDAVRGHIQWLSNTCFVRMHNTKNGSLTYFMHPKTQTVDRKEMGPELLWSYIAGHKQRVQLEVVKSQDQKAAVIYFIENDKLKEIRIDTLDNEEIQGHGSINQQGTILGFSTNKHHYIYRTKTGELLKAVDNDGKDKVKYWDFNDNNDYIAIIKEQSMDILDKNFNLLKTISYGQPITSAMFRRQGTLFNAWVKGKGLYYYVVNKDGFTEVVQEKK